MSAPDGKTPFDRALQSLGGELPPPVEPSLPDIYRDQARRIVELEGQVQELTDACNVALGHLTCGMDGDWRDCDPAPFAGTLRGVRGRHLNLRSRSILRSDCSMVSP